MTVPVVWITGRPASGKTTLAARICAALLARSVRTTVLDSDEVRAVVTPEPKYTDEERGMFYRALAYMAHRLAQEDVVPVVAATAHEPRFRDLARSLAEQFVLVHARCPAAVAEARDPKALYRRAHASPQGTMPGVHVAYHQPTDAEIEVDTSRDVPQREIERVVERLISAGARPAR